MKTILLISSLLCATLNAADFTASSFFQTPISEQGEVKPAGGVNFRAIVWNGFGADMDLIQSAFRDDFIDRVAPHAVYRHDLTKSIAAIGFAGVAYDCEDDEHGVEAGAGLEYNFENGPVVGFNLRWQKDDTDQHVIVPTLSAGWRF